MCRTFLSQLMLKIVFATILRTDSLMNNTYMLYMPQVHVYDTTLFCNLSNAVLLTDICSIERFHDTLLGLNGY